MTNGKARQRLAWQVLLGLVAVCFPALAGPSVPRATEPPETACDVAAPPESARLIILISGGGAALSSAAVGGPDEKTTLATIRVEPGSEPLYVILPRNLNMIWKFEGEVSRVVAAVLPGYG